MKPLDPWEAYSFGHQRGERIKTTIASLVDFGILVELEDGIKGIVHLGDIDWVESGEIAIKRYTVGDFIEATILSIDVERQRISLSIKHITKDPRKRPRDDGSPVGAEPNNPKSPKPLSAAARARADG